MIDRGQVTLAMAKKIQKKIIRVSQTIFTTIRNVLLSALSKNKNHARTTVNNAVNNI